MLLATLSVVVVVLRKTKRLVVGRLVAITYCKVGVDFVGIV